MVVFSEQDLDPEYHPEKECREAQRAEAMEEEE